MEGKITNFTKSILGLLIPLFFAVLAGYQEVTDGKVDKYIIGVLLIFGLGSLGWRIDILLEKYLEAKGRAEFTIVRSEEKDPPKKTEEGE